MGSGLFAGRRMMWLPLDFPVQAPASSCCAGMQTALDFFCDQHDDVFACPDSLIVHHAPFNEWGLIVHDGGPSYVLIGHCPWCGHALGPSRRDAWFDTLEAMGITEPDASNVPPQFLTAAWHAKPPTAPKET